MNEVLISRPWKEERNGWSAVCCTVTMDGKGQQLWIEVPSPYGMYLVTERADAFLVAALPMIARRGGRVRVEAPVSGMLLHNLRNLLSPCMPLLDSGFSELHIEAEAEETMMHPHGQHHVGTGCSCGVDSIASYLMNSRHNNTPEEICVDTLAFFDGGQHDDLDHDLPLEMKKERHDTMYPRRLKLAQDFAGEVGLPLLEIRSSLSYFHDGWKHINLHTFRDAACVLAIQKYFSAYHFASAVHVENFKFSMSAPAMSEEYLLRCMSTESTRLYSSLAASTRYDRTKILSDFGPAQKLLNVCIHGAPNCGKCFKCVRTMLQLDQMGKLDAFEGVFDTSCYRSTKAKEKGVIEWEIMNDSSYMNEFLHYAAQPGVNPHAVYNYESLAHLLKYAPYRKLARRLKNNPRMVLHPIKRFVKWAFRMDK